MPSQFPQSLEGDASQYTDRYHCTDDQHNSAHHNQHAGTQFVQTTLRTLDPTTSSQASPVYTLPRPQHSFDPVLPTSPPSSFQNNWHYTALGHQVWNARRLNQGSYYPANHKQPLHGFSTPTDRPRISYPTSHIRDYRESTNAHHYISNWPVRQQRYHFLQPDHESFPTQAPIHQEHGCPAFPIPLSVHTLPQMPRRNYQPIVSPNAQSHIIPVTLPQRPFTESHHPCQGLPHTMGEHGSSGSLVEDPITRVYKDVIQLPDAPAEAILPCYPMNSPPPFPVPKRKWNGWTSRSAKRPRNNRQEPSGRSPTHNEDGRQGCGALNEEDYTQEHHDLVLSGASSLTQSPLTRIPAIAKGARSEPPNGFFSHSRNNVIHQPIMVDNSRHDNSQHHHTESNQPDGTLLWLKDYIMVGAELDSSERDPPPRCHANTRASIINKMLGWIKDPRREKKMRWVRGTAGVGKSAIIQTILEKLPKENRGGSVFLSKPNGRDNPNQVFPSIAYQLAVRNLSYRAYLKELMLEDPRSLCKSMKEQFRILFSEPFANRKLLVGDITLVIALDGLDECGGDPTYRAAEPTRSHSRSSEFVQREIVELISGFIQQHISIPLIWIIASRPEKHLQVTFAGETVQPAFSEEEVPVNSIEACEDVEKFLNSEFTRIKKDHEDLISTTPWPSNDDFSLIAAKASGLFIFAQVLIRFIDDSNPIQQLKYAVAAILKASSSQAVENPFFFLDAMYMEIVSKVPSKLLEPAAKMIGTIVLLDRKNVRKFEAALPTVCNILGISKDVALSALRHLHSVLYFPKETLWTRPSFYHASFHDFIEDESRSREYAINEVKISDDLSEGLMKFYKKRTINVNMLSWSSHRDAVQLIDIGDVVHRNLDFENFLLLHNRIRLFSKEFTVSEATASQILLHHDFAADLRYLRLRADLQYQPELHKRTGILSRKSLASFGINGDSICMCKTSEKAFTFYVISFNKVPYNLPLCNDAEIKAICSLLRLSVDEEPERLVTVWGHEQLRRSAVFWLSITSPLAYIRLYCKSLPNNFFAEGNLQRFGIVVIGF